MADGYAEFLDGKRHFAPSVGVEVRASELHASLFPFQRDLVRWALRKGRAAIFADTGLGKTFMQLEWARRIGERTLILAPLAVTRQTVEEAGRWGIGAVYARSQGGASEGGITVTNYEMLGAFDPSAFGAVVLDESSILKNFEGKTRTALIRAFSEMRYRLACTATPAPNDVAELANHAEFLGVMTRTEMLAAFFVHDDAGWRLKGHAQDAFHRWLASWGMHLRRPSDLGHDDAGYALPPLEILAEIVPTDWRPEGSLVAVGLRGIGERSQVRKSTMAERVGRALSLIGAESEEPWIAWVGLNAEGRALAAALPDAVLVEGAQTADEKEESIARWLSGGARVLVTKPRIAGFGLNLQRCARMAFVGLSDSYEQYYQCVRRCWRFGQLRPVRAHVVLSEPEAAIYNNVLRKEREAIETADGLISHIAEFERAEIRSAKEPEPYSTTDAEGNSWRLLLGDAVERLYEVLDASVDLSVFSPPFQALYTYSASPRDVGNCRGREDFWRHLGFVTRHLLRVMRPGRNVCVHVSQLARTKATHGVIGLEDFRGDMIRHYDAEGFIYHGEVCVDKDPQAQAIRTHAKGLLFVQLHKDAAWMRPAFADYVLIFRTPGENGIPVIPDITNDQWIEWARPVWYGISATDTLNVQGARENSDDRHICPLQLGVIERCVRLWSNKGETVLSPFAGIGSEGYEAVRLGRKFVGVELKASYFEVAKKNLAEAVRRFEEGDMPLFAFTDGRGRG